MRVMVFCKATKDIEAGVMPTAQEWQEMEQFQGELAKAGIVVDGAGLLPSSQGVRVSGKNHLVTNGPFAETKELVAGYSIWEVQSMDEALAWVKRFPMNDDSVVEVRPIFMYSATEVSEMMAQNK